MNSSTRSINETRGTTYNVYGEPIRWMTQKNVWFIGLSLLYPLCRWFADLKRRRHDWWLSYL